MILKGVAASGGIGLGIAVCVKEERLDYSDVKYSGAENEKARLKAGINAFNERTSAMAEKVRTTVGQKESEILTGQMAMLDDPFMQSQMEESIDGGCCAEAAVDAICNMYVEMFLSIEDDMMRQRATDVKDLRARLISILLGSEGTDLSALPAGTVLVARELTPSMTVGLNKENVVGIVTATGGITSHSAILARALQLPAVLSVTNALDLIKDGDGLIVDGSEGIAILNPDGNSRSEYLKKQEEYIKKVASLKVFEGKPTVDADGKLYNLYANIGSPKDAVKAANAGAEGVGLFRTEFLFMDRDSLPDENTQYEAYKAASNAMQGKEVIIRTLDVGGDKEISYLNIEKEENPFLGYRAIRYCLDNPELFKVQLRALLRAGADNKNIRIMLPMITCVEEIRAAKALAEECKKELAAEGLAYDKDILIGIMVETPSAAISADILAKESDFFSIGTNDLTGYVMCADRGNAKVENLYTHFHPGVLRAIRSTILAAKEAGIPVGMCGEAAADPMLIPLLMAWGLDEFSVSTSSILATRAAINKWSGEQAATAAAEALSLSDAAGIRGYLKSITD